MMWTMQKITSKQLKMLNGDISSPQESCEVVEFLFPVLHAEIDLGNDVLNSFFDFIDERVENITAEETALCNAHLLVEVAHDEAASKIS